MLSYILLKQLCWSAKTIGESEMKTMYFICLKYILYVFMMVYGMSCFKHPVFQVGGCNAAYGLEDAIMMQTW